VGTAMQQEHHRPWERMIRDLHRGFNLLDQEIGLLRDIDQTILSIGGDGRASRSLEDLFLVSIERFSRIHRLHTPVLCYVYLGEHLALLQEAGQESPHPTRISISSALDPFLKAAANPRLTPIVVTRDAGDDIFSVFTDAKTILLCPMYSSSGTLFCIFLLADNDPPEGSHLSDPDFKHSITSLVSQLAIAYGHRDRDQQHQRIQELWSKFLELNLSPTMCFQHLTRKVPEFLPKFGSLKIVGPTPEVQALMLVRDNKGSPDHLVIRGTTGHEYSGTRVAIERSICGLLVTDEKLPLFCDDPTKPKYAHLYRNYLGHAKQIKTELVVRITKGAELVGVLNLESETVDAFNIHHREAILSLANTIAPLVTVFEQRITMNTLMQHSVTTSTRQYLEALAGTFGHAVGTPLRSMRTNIRLASDMLSNDANRALEAIRSTKQETLAVALDEASRTLTQIASAHARLLKDYTQIHKYTSDFTTDIASYADAGPMSIREVLKSAVELASDSLLTAGANIQFSFEKDETSPATRVVGSNLLKQHLFSIFNNAILSIEERMLADHAPGVITISISEDQPPESQEVSLNRSWAVRIRDNGMGVSPEQLDALRRFDPGVRFRKSTGHGFGLTAAHRYMAAIDGRIELDSEKGRFFEVRLYFAASAPPGRTLGPKNT
jgi:signal transduction histidine kinase